jgi:hypothetical protein
MVAGKTGVINGERRGRIDNGQWIIDNAEKSRLVESMGRVRVGGKMKGVESRALSEFDGSLIPPLIDGWRRWLEAWVAYADGRVGSVVIGGGRFDPTYVGMLRE